MIKAEIVQHNLKITLRKVDVYAGGSGHDKYYEQAFTNKSIVSVAHNLDKFPAVTAKDSAGDEVEGAVSHSDKNNLTVIFSAPFSGVIMCN